MTDRAKMLVRSQLYRRNLELSKDPLPRRIVAALSWLGADTVLDVGANVGQYADALRSSGYRGRIISFEPLAEAYARLAHHAAKDPGWTAVHSAVGAEPGTLEIHIAANSHSSSALPMNRTHLDAAPHSRTIGIESAPVTTIADVVATYGVAPERTLLKVDTQGYEAPVLDGAGELLREFALIQLELSFVSLYDGQALYPELVARLAGLGFEWYGVDAAFVDPRTGRMLQVDGLFARSSLLDRPVS
ncbi:MAG TPA: FkbM family methyltransferase [Jatrophihabitantaceae bacterium]|nr:FkbM family methyltransferase [Jatrophihabitantaceae bacterium]